MFTGLVETTGTLRQTVRRGPGFRLSIATSLGPLELGESIAVNGACLTVAAIAPWGFEADVSLETVEKTTLGRVSTGSALNLERSLSLGQRLGGHLVSGHVDGLAVVVRTEAAGEALRAELAVAPAFKRFVAAKGSVVLDGVSLTVNALTDAGFEIMLIPHTLGVTNLKDLNVGRELNFEIDLLARYVVHYLESTREPAAGVSELASRDASLRAALERAGIL